MKKNSLKDEILDLLEDKFLYGDESNFSSMTYKLEHLHKEFDVQNEYDAVIGTCNFDWMSKYEKIPTSPQINNEILSDSLNAFRGQIRWHSHGAMHNINPPIMLDSVIGSFFANLYNPNCLWDYTSAGALQMEKQIIRQIAGLCEWESDYDGIFTFGGKACLIYAIRIGLNRLKRNISWNGISELRKAPVVITSEDCHYTITYACTLLGIGEKNCIRIRTNNEVIDLKELYSKLSYFMSNDIPIACIVVSGGNTINNSVDPLREIYEMVHKLVRKYKLTYVPYIHFDTVVGWPWIFFNKYDFKKNKLGFEEESLQIVEQMYEKIKDVKYADSIGVDFHKIGFTSYASSLFLIQNGAELHSINKDKIKRLPRHDYKKNFMQHHSIEHSRSFAPIISSWLVLQNVGVEGFQAYIGNLIEIAQVFRHKLEKHGFIHINKNSLGFASIFWTTFDSSLITYNKIIDEELDKKTIDKQNEYIFNLCNAFESGLYSNARFVFAYVPDYCQSKRLKKNIYTIRIYPMAINLSVNECKKIIEEILNIKKSFDKDYLLNDGTNYCDNSVNSVPK